MTYQHETTEILGKAYVRWRMAFKHHLERSAGLSKRIWGIWRDQSSRGGLVVFPGPLPLRRSTGVAKRVPVRPLGAGRRSPTRHHATHNIIAASLRFQAHQRMAWLSEGRPLRAQPVLHESAPLAADTGDGGPGGGADGSSRGRCRM